MEGSRATRKEACRKGKETGKRKPGAAHRQESKQREQEQSVNGDINGVKVGVKNGVKDVFKILYTNAHSICNKMDELRCLVLDQNPDFILVNEAWTNDNHNAAFLKLDGYNIICRHDRTDTTEGIGGGLIVWAKGNLIVTEIRSNCLDVFNQCCSVNLSLADGTSVSLVLIYRPHNLYNTEVTERENNIKLCNILKSFTGPSLFIGDFNYSDIDWDHLSATN